MAEKGIVKRCCTWLGRFRRPPQAHAQLQARAGQQQAGEAAAAGQAEKTHVELLLEGMERQASQTDALLRQLQDFLDASSRLCHAFKSLEAPQPAVKSMTQIAERSEELVHELQSLVENSDRQIDLLQKIQVELPVWQSGQAEASAAMSRLSGALENLSRNSAGHAELMEQVRDRLAAGNDDLAEMIALHGRRLTALLLGVLGMLAALAAILALKAF